MASTGAKMGAALMLVTLLWAGAKAQSGCNNVLISMAPCVNYVTGSSSTPSSSCCSSLASVVQSQPQCLCSALNGGGAAFGININQTLALSLPGACKVQTPPVSQCNAANNGPVMSPVGSPGSSPAETSSDGTSGSTGSAPAKTGSPTGSTVSGSKTVPANGATSGSSVNTINMPFQLVAFALVTASYASIVSSS